MRILVVYYSRTGITRDLALAIAAALGADVEEIVEPTSRGGLTGFLRSGLESILERTAAVRPSTREARDYDLVIVGTPVWALNVSSPVRAYLTARRGKLPRVAFFCTMGGSGGERAFHTMETLAGAHPVARLALAEGARWRAGQRALRDFLAAVKVAGAAPPAEVQKGHGREASAGHVLS
jgi:flavodoxin